MRKHYNIVGAGVDTFKASAVGDIREEVAELMDLLQLKAIEERERKKHRGEVLMDTHWRLAGQPVQMRPYGGGKGQWKWLLWCPFARFEVGLSQLNGIGCQVILSSLFLWKYGYEQAWALIQELLEQWFCKGVWFQVSDLDICVDLAGLSVSQIHQQHFVTRSQVARWYAMDAALIDWKERQDSEDHEPIVEVVARYREQETLIFSKGAPVSVEIYDKVAEIQRHSRDKQWFYELWKSKGWNGIDPVTRIEGKLAREALHELGIETVADAFKRLDELWAYITQKWVRHTLPKGKQRKFWPTSAWWQVVQQVIFQSQVKTIPERTPQHNYQEERMIAALCGYVESWVAWRAGETGEEPESDIWDHLIRLAERAKVHYEAKGVYFLDQVAKKAKVLGFQTPGQQKKQEDLDEEILHQEEQVLKAELAWKSAQKLGRSEDIVQLLGAKVDQEVQEWVHLLQEAENVG
jgi:hypothetical protein